MKGRWLIESTVIDNQGRGERSFNISVNPSLRARTSWTNCHLIRVVLYNIYTQLICDLLKDPWRLAKQGWETAVSQEAGVLCRAAASANEDRT